MPEIALLEVVTLLRAIVCVCGLRFPPLWTMSYITVFFCIIVFTHYAQLREHAAIFYLD